MFTLPTWLTSIKKLFGAADGKVLARSSGAWAFIPGIPTGGTPGQVLKKATEENYATQWGEDSRGHTILNGGAAMAQRTNLNFVGLTVEDNEAGDSTTISVQSGSSYSLYLYRTLSGGL
jgi:hypothetical protein